MKKVMVVLAVVFLVSSAAVAEDSIDAVKSNIKKEVAVVSAAVPSVTVEKFMKILQEQKEFFEIIDVRGADEYGAGHLADAIWIPRGKAEWMTPKKITDPSTPIYVYCKAGSRGALVTKMLLDAGYARVTNISGGFKAWAKAGYPFYNMHGKCVVVEGGYEAKPE